jgi:hypothetical protein
MTTAATAGNYWDRWEAKALSAGMPAHLASLGRELMRDLVQHTAGEIRGLGHEGDGDGDKMIAMALAAPITMELRFASDLRTPAGVSGRVDPEVYELLAARLGGAAVLDAALASEKPAHDAAARSVRTHRFFKDAYGHMTTERISA